MQVLASKDGDLSSYYVEFIGKCINDTSLEEILPDDQKTQTIKPKVLGELKIEQIFGFCKKFEKIAKGLSFHLAFKTEGFQNKTYTTLLAATVISVHFIHIHLFVPMLIPHPETQSDFNNSIKKSFTLS